MAAEPLFDLSSIDLDAIAVSADEVGRINPHAGHMRHLDHAIHMNEHQSVIVGVKHVGADEFWVEGHVPGRPLLPGVIMIEAAAQLSSLLYNIRAAAQGREPRFLGFTRCDDASFRTQVVPGDTLHLITREKSFGRRRFITDNQGYVNGDLAFEVRVTGMVM